MTLKWQRNQNVKFWNNYIFIDHKIRKAEKFWHFINNLSRDVKTIETQLENKQNFPICLFHDLSSILPKQTFFQDLNLPAVKGVKTRRLICERNLDKLALGFSNHNSYHGFIFHACLWCNSPKVQKATTKLPPVRYLFALPRECVCQQTHNPLYFQFFGVLIVARFGNLVIMNEKLFITDWQSYFVSAISGIVSLVKFVFRGMTEIESVRSIVSNPLQPTWHHDWRGAIPRVSCRRTSDYQTKST